MKLFSLLLAALPLTHSFMAAASTSNSTVPSTSALIQTFEKCATECSATEFKCVNSFGKFACVGTYVYCMEKCYTADFFSCLLYREACVFNCGDRTCISACNDATLECIFKNM